MQYLSPEFALVFLVFVWGYWFVAIGSGPKRQNQLLLVASYGFYCAFDWRFPLLLAVFSVSILALAKLASTDNPRRPWLLACGTWVALANLAIFKYYNFFREGWATWFDSSSLPVLDILLPIGISFYTFAGLNYLFTIGRGERAPASWCNGLLYLSFFPTLLAGPICRPQELLTQIESPATRQIRHPEKALLLIISALVKKVWLASWLAQTWVNPVFADPGQYQTLELIGAVVAYAWQLYFDFSGYSDLVTALALLLGFNLPVNFRQPYLALNLSQFWQRWHITLSRWIRDFVYIPIGGNRGHWLRTQLNLVIAMALSGLWHGAGLTFIIWGLWHGLGLIGQNCWRRYSTKALPNNISQILTFGFVCLGWVFFRADNIGVVADFFMGLANWQQKTRLNWPLLLLFLTGFFIAARRAEPLMQQFEDTLIRMLWWQKSCCCALVTLAIFACAPAGVPSFIYFGF